MAGTWDECLRVMDASVMGADVVDAALPPGDRSRTLVRADLRMAAPGLGMGAACALSVGGFASFRYWSAREISAEYVLFWEHVRTTFRRWSGDGSVRGVRPVPSGS